MRAQLQAYIRDELLDGREVSCDENLLLSGLIDSMGVMRLLVHIEEDHGLVVPPEDLTIENFMSIDAIARYLEHRRAG